MLFSNFKSSRIYRYKLTLLMSVNIGFSTSTSTILATHKGHMLPVDKYAVVNKLRIQISGQPDQVTALFEFTHETAILH